MIGPPVFHGPQHCPQTPYVVPVFEFMSNGAVIVVDKVSDIPDRRDQRAASNSKWVGWYRINMTASKDISVYREK